MDKLLLDPDSKLFTLEFIMKTSMQIHADEINQISGGATQEMQIEASANEIE